MTGNRYRSPQRSFSAHRSSIRAPEIRVIPSIFALIEPADRPVAERNELKFRLIIFALACRARGPPTRDETSTRRGVAREKFRPRSLSYPTMKFLGKTEGFARWMYGWIEEGYIYIYIYRKHGSVKKKNLVNGISGRGRRPEGRGTATWRSAQGPTRSFNRRKSNASG